MTTRITVDAHAGWPVRVTTVDRLQNGALARTETIVKPHTEMSFHVWDTRDIEIHEVQPNDTERLLSFGEAIEALKSGYRVGRKGWNGKGMWLSLSCDGTREVAAENFWSKHNAEFARENGGKAVVLPSITMKTATGEILMGWLASQTDMLAVDWQIVS